MSGEARGFLLDVFKTLASGDATTQTPDISGRERRRPLGGYSGTARELFRRKTPYPAFEGGHNALGINYLSSALTAATAEWRLCIFVVPTMTVETSGMRAALLMAAAGAMSG